MVSSAREERRIKQPGRPFRIRMRHMQSDRRDDFAYELEHWINELWIYEGLEFVAFEKLLLREVVAVFKRSD